MEIASDKYIADVVRAYLKTFAGNFDITERAVQSLMESHSHLRSLNLDVHSEYEKYLAEHKAQWKSILDDSVVESFIREKLRNMTLQEVANYIGEDNG